MRRSPLTLAPLVVEGDDLVEELEGCRAVALQLAQWVAALLHLEEVDVKHLLAPMVGEGMRRRIERKG